MFLRITRMVSPSCPRAEKALHRKRADSGNSYAKANPSTKARLTSSTRCGGSRAPRIARTSSRLSGCPSTLRICPVVGSGSTPPERQYNVEYRAADATANPYLILGALIAAGLDGIRSGLMAPPLVNVDPSELPAEQLAAQGIERLPQSLGEALDRLEADDVLRAALGEPLVAAFLLAKRHEIEECDGLDADAVCQRYAAIY